MASVAFLFVASIVGSVCFHDWTWFGRAGGVITILGGVLAARRLIRLRLDELFEAARPGDDAPLDASPDDFDPEERLDMRAGKLSLWVVSAGTLIWAFGDLLGKVFN